MVLLNEGEEIAYTDDNGNEQTGTIESNLMQWGCLSLEESGPDGQSVITALQVHGVSIEDDCWVHEHSLVSGDSNNT